VSFNLAQVNIAFARYRHDDPRFAGFVDNLNRVYGLAEATMGFIWRHVSVDDDAEAKAVFGDQSLVFNMALWWQPAGTIPTIAESRHRLERLAQAGSGEDTFTFLNFFNAPTEKDADSG
jgi:hypothetical protein